MEPKNPKTPEEKRTPGMKTPEEKRTPGMKAGSAPGAAKAPKAKKGKAPKAKKKKSGTLGRVAFTLLVTLAVLALAFFLVMRDQGNVSLSENTVGSVFAPVQNAVSSATRYVRDLVQGAKDYVELTHNYELAQREIASLQLQLQIMEEEARENDRLKGLLDAKDRYGTMKPIYASVIARNPGVWMDTFTINCGSNDGVQVDMAVVTGDGLVGRVLEVGLNYAKVLTIVDTRSSVSCLIERTRENGIMRGQVDSSSDTQECHMYYLPSVNNIAPGDVVLTAGNDSVFPKGLKVGTVASISRQTDVSDQYIVVMPSVNFLQIEEVLVLRTQVEDSSRGLSPLPTPTPSPTPVPTPTPMPSEVDEEEVDPDSQIWQWPTNASQDGEDQSAASPTPAPTVNPNGPPEDAWANSAA